MSALLRLCILFAMGYVSGTMARSQPIPVDPPIEPVLVTPSMPEPPRPPIRPVHPVKPGVIPWDLLNQREEFGSLSREKPADAEAQSVADSVRGQLEKKLGAGKVTLNKVIKYKTKSVDLARPGGGLTGGVNYYLKVEISPGKYIHENVMVGGDDDARLNSAELDKTLHDEIKEFWNSKW